MPSGTGFFYKSASLPPDNQHWKYLGCWLFDLGWYPAGHPDLEFRVQKDSSYLILCDGFDPVATHIAASFPFVMGGCVAGCRLVDTIILLASTGNSLTLRWNQPSPGCTYTLEYQPFYSGNAPTVISNLRDTTFTLTGLFPVGEYKFWLRTHCPDGSSSGQRFVKFVSGSHPEVRETYVSRFTPRMVSPCTGTRNGFEVLSLQVPIDGTYYLACELPECYVYEGNFDPENPALNLKAGAFESEIPGYSYRRDTTLALQSGKSYFLVGTGLSFNDFLSGQGYFRFFLDGPAPITLGQATILNKEPKPHGIVPDFPDWNYKIQTYSCVDTSGWRNFYAVDVGNIQQPDKDVLLLSMENYPASEGLDNNKLELWGGPGASLITHPPAQYALNPSGWYAMNRFWNFPDVEPWCAPTKPVKVRSYYTEQDFKALKTAIEGAGGILSNHEALYFYKINGVHDPNILTPINSHPGMPAATSYDAPYGYWEYKNGTEATASTWRHGTLGNAHYAEILLRNFSGGGGGASVNGKSALNPTVSIINIDKNMATRLSPNPNTGAFTIELSGPAPTGLLLYITDTRGRLML